MNRVSFVFLCLLTSACFGQSNFPATLGSIRIAEAFPGSDCGAKIMAAFGDFPSGSTGQVWVSKACGMSWSTPVNIPSGGSLAFTQSGVYTSSGGITMNSNSALYSQAPSASNAGPVTIKALSLTGTSSLITVNGPQAVIHDLILDGSNSSLGGCASDGGATRVLYLSPGAGRFQAERLQVQCSGGAGIYNEGAQNIDLSHLEVLFNKAQGFYCLNAGDGFIQSDSQFEGNGWSGVELNGCGSYRLVNVDIAGNGSLGLDKSTGCSLYIHGTYNSNPAKLHAANNNTFVQLQQGNDAFEDICDIGWDSANNGRDSYLNSFIGYQSLGASGNYPQIYVSDGSNDLFLGTIGLRPSGYAVQFTEGNVGRAIPSSVRLTFAAGYSSSTAWTDTTRYGDDFTGSIIGSTKTYHIGPYVVCTQDAPNSQCTETVMSANNPAAPVYTDNSTFDIIAPQLKPGGYQLGFQIGQAQDTKYQAGYFRFVYQGNGSAQNKTCFGIDGANGLCMSGAGVPSVSSNYVPVQSTGTQTAGKLACIKAVGPPPVIGTCTAISGATCTTCN